MKKESGSKLEQLIFNGKNPVNAPKVTSYGYFSSRSNKIVKSADFSHAFGLSQMKAAERDVKDGVKSPNSSMNDTDEREQPRKDTGINLNRHMAAVDEDTYET